MNPITAARTAYGVSRAVLRWERPDRLIRNLAVAGAIGPTIAGAIAGSTARAPEHPAVSDAQRQLTYGGLWRAAQQFAAVLRRSGVEPGTVVGILAGNSVEFVVGVVACSIVGADVVYLNTGFATPQLVEVVARERVEFIVSDPTTESAASTLGLGMATPCVDTIGRTGRGRSLRPSLRSTRQVILTSGTTGTPKGAQRRGVGTSGMGLFAAVPIRSGDRVVIASPLFHAWGLSQLLVALTLGSTVRLTATAHPEDIAALLGPVDDDPQPADGLILVPTVLARLVADVDAAGFDTDSWALRYVATSGSALSVPVVRRALDLFGPSLYNLYGATEVALATVAGPTELSRYPTTAGRAVPGTTIAIVDEHDQPVKAGTTGRVLVANGGAFDGYTGGGDKVRIGNLVDTGDVGHFVGDLLFVEGRSDDMIVSGGENVFPIEVEHAIASLYGVRDVAVIGVPDDEFGQRLAAVVVAQQGGGEHVVTADRVRSTVRERLARYKVPRDVIFVDRIPRTESGKIRRGAVAALINAPHRAAS